MINRICVYLHSCFRTGSSFSKIFSKKNAEIAQLVEHQLPKLRVASSNLVFRSLIIKQLQRCDCFFCYAKIGLFLWLKCTLCGDYAFNYTDTSSDIPVLIPEKFGMDLAVSLSVYI